MVKVSIRLGELDQPDDVKAVFLDSRGLGRHCIFSRSLLYGFVATPPGRADMASLR
jgi:hypothetical protein